MSEKEEPSISDSILKKYQKSCPLFFLTEQEIITLYRDLTNRVARGSFKEVKQVEKELRKELQALPKLEKASKSKVPIKEPKKAKESKASQAPKSMKDLLAKRQKLFTKKAGLAGTVTKKIREVNDIKKDLEIAKSREAPDQDKIEGFNEELEKAKDRLRKAGDKFKEVDAKLKKIDAKIKKAQGGKLRKAKKGGCCQFCAKGGCTCCS